MIQTRPQFYGLVWFVPKGHILNALASLHGWGPRLNKKGEGSKAAVCISLLSDCRCNVTSCMAPPPPPFPFPTYSDGQHTQNVSQDESFLLKLLLLDAAGHMARAFRVNPSISTNTV